MPIYIHHPKTLIDVTTEAVEGGRYDEEGILLQELKNVANAKFRAFDIKAQCDDLSIFNDWTDIIHKVDIYVSEQADTTYKGFPSIRNRKVEMIPYGSTGIKWQVSGDVPYGEPENSEEALINISAISYLIKSLPLTNIYDNLEGLRGGALSKEIMKLKDGVIVNLKDFESWDALRVQEVLKNDDMKHYIMIPSMMSAYNNSLFVANAKQVIGYDYNSLNAYEKEYIETNDNLDTYYQFYITYRLKSITGEKIINAGPFVYRTVVGVTKPYTEKIYAFQVFPDSRAYQMDVVINIFRDELYGEPTKIMAGSFEMKPHPFLNCAYYYNYADEGLDLISLCNEVIEAPARKADDNVDEMSNKLLMSSMDLPFTFPANRTVTYQSKIIGLAAVTAALSQGQFGQFDLYTFTEDGIWVNQTKEDGTLSPSKQLSREVCVNPDSITPIDQAVVFVTDKGVMYLSGSQITELSPNMNGRHYVIEETAKTIIQGQDFFCDMLPALSDKTHFMAFVKQATISYDYAGKRLVFIKKGEKFQYIYKLDTQTWHKMYMNVDLIAPLNSYPEALVQGEYLGRTKIYDLSTILDAAQEQTPTRGVIATRPFDLGEPDVLKTITDVRIRGQFPKGAVKFILLGSNDGINFATLSTLRGRAWKMFRMIILADLAPTDRISWIDVQYETKFTNRLR